MLNMLIRRSGMSLPEQESQNNIENRIEYSIPNRYLIIGFSAINPVRGTISNSESRISKYYLCHIICHSILVIFQYIFKKRNISFLHSVIFLLSQCPFVQKIGAIARIPHKFLVILHFRKVKGSIT